MNLEYQKNIDSVFSKSKIRNDFVKSNYVPTEGIKYSGSKLKLLPYILSIIRFLPVRTVFDGFSGTTRVSQALAYCDYNVISNDLAIWSKVFGECYLKGVINKQLEEKICYLNSLPGKNGWFTEHYGGKANKGLAIQSDGKKRIWQVHNSKKLDAIRPQIDKIADNSVEHSVLLTSLILALDKVDNTLGHYVSYLKFWSSRSFNKLKLTVPLISRKHDCHRILNKDIFGAFKLVKKADLSYFDPPYGSNNEKMPPSRVRYASYYHIWKTICLNDQPELTGATNRRKDCSDKEAGSVFEEFRKNKAGQFISLRYLDKLIKNCPSPYILLSYSNGGRVKKKEIKSIIEKQCKKLKIFSIDYKKNVMAGMHWTGDWIKEKKEKNIEFLFLIQK